MSCYGTTAALDQRLRRPRELATGHEPPRATGATPRRHWMSSLVNGRQMPKVANTRSHRTEANALQSDPQAGRSTAQLSGWAAALSSGWAAERVGSSIHAAKQACNRAGRVVRHARSHTAWLRTSDVQRSQPAANQGSNADNDVRGRVRPVRSRRSLRWRYGGHMSSRRGCRQPLGLPLCALHRCVLVTLAPLRGPLSCRSATGAMRQSTGATPELTARQPWWEQQHMTGLHTIETEPSCPRDARATRSLLSL
eukprot:363847-Chlamydomonas_euryale.AAC.8